MTAPSENAINEFLFPEAELLLCCAKGPDDSSVGKRIKQLASDGIDWEGLLVLADRHGMMPHLYRNLKTLCPKVIPKQLHYRYRVNLLHNRFLAAETLQILDILKENGIPAIPYKGPALAFLLYGDMSLRQSCDIDIVVKRADVVPARELILGQGFCLAGEFSEAQDTWWRSFAGEYNFVRDNMLSLELHWHFVEEYFCFHFDYERMWRQLQNGTLGERQVLRLCPEDLLLVLCVHGAKHGWDQLNLICDIAQLARTHPLLDWRKVWRLARESGTLRMLRLGLFLADAVAGAELPEDVRNRLQQDGAVKTLTKEIYQRLFQEDEDFNMVFFHLQTRERVRDQLSYCRRFQIRTTTGRGVGMIPSYLSREDWLKVPQAILFLATHHRLMRYLLLTH